MQRVRQRDVERVNAVIVDKRLIAGYGARFSGVAYPGETLKVNVWKDNGRFLASVVAPSRDDAVVLTGVELIPA